MIQLFLNEQEVHIQTNSSIKLIKENPLFTKSSSSTFTISIPMTVPQNVKVLGHLNRIDLSQSTITFTAKLIIDSKTWITGEAVITEITKELVKLQILAGTSLMNFHNKTETIYIDELDLGIWPVSYIGDSVKSTYGMFYTIWGEYVRLKKLYNIRTAQEYLFNSLFGNNDWVAFPIYNETSEIMCNDWIFRHVVDEEESDRDNVALEPRYSINKQYSEQGYPQVRFSIQPYLITMIKKVFRTLGYSIDVSSLENDKLFSKIFIACANEEINCNSSLPHWTVSEFIEQLENFYGLVFTVDETDNKLSLATRSDFCNCGVYEINDVLDEFTVSCEKEDAVTFSDKNIGYEDVDPFTRIDISILQHAHHKYYNTLQDFLNDRETLGGQAYYDNFKGYIIHVKDSKESFIVTAPDAENADSPWFRRVDFFKNRGATDSDVNLKIVPVKCNYEYEVDSFINGNIWDGYFSYLDSRSTAIFRGGAYRMAKTDIPLRAWTEPINTGTNNIYITDIVAAINGEENITEYDKDDLMRVAINANAYSKLKGMTLNKSYRTIYRFFPKPITYSWEKEYEYDYDYQDKQNTEIYGLNLCDGIPTTSIASEVFGKGPKIEAYKKYCIRFITDKILNPNYRFIIHNQVYLCEKLEYTTKDDSMDKIVTGYFYRLEE
ncbi:MAG: hypothetical protein IKY71_05480, partial [Bacteroidaceae bacterium]|nr:hypothetical protein [Bacteroidaceae bacterium]